MNEDEHLQRAHEQWLRFRFVILTGLAMVLALTVGFIYQKEQSDGKRQVANTLLFDAIAAAQTDDRSTVLANHAALQSAAYGDSNALRELKTLSAFAVAHLDEVDEETVAVMRSAIAETSNKELKILAVVRLAEVLLRQGQLSEAQHLLSEYQPAEDEPFYPLFAERLGDAFFLQGEHDVALLHYQRALLTAGRAVPNYHAFLQIKIGAVLSEKVSGENG